jgi:hypothetical protein
MTRRKSNGRQCLFYDVVYIEKNNMMNLKRVLYLDEINLNKDNLLFDYFILSLESLVNNDVLITWNTNKEKINYIDNMRSIDADKMIEAFITTLPTINITKKDHCRLCNTQYNIVIGENDLNFFI